MAASLTEEAVRSALSGLTAWEGDARAIARTYRFGSFGAAMAFMVEAALAAEKADHHPEWTNVYNRVEVRLTTHDANGVTEKDVALARAFDSIAGTG